MIKKKIAKILAVTLVGTLLNGVLVFSAFATPDEWFPDSGLYMEFNDELMPTISEEDFGQYVVKSGDNLISIANKLGCSQSQLISVNQLTDPGLIREGQVLMIPGSVSYYRVCQGDTLIGIADNFGVSVKQLIISNALKNENQLFVGQKLMIIKGTKGNTVLSSSSRSIIKQKLEWPVVGWISSPFGMRDGRPHEGMDIAANLGDPIVAATEGGVVFAGDRGTYGLTVIIDHGEGLTTLYAHCSEILVNQGQQVSRGHIIAKVGNTGRSNGPHLHIEVLSDGVPYDPMPFFERMAA